MYSMLVVVGQTPKAWVSVVYSLIFARILWGKSHQPTLLAQHQFCQKDVLVVPEDVILVLLHRDRSSPVLRNQHLVAGPHAAGHPLAFLVEPAGSHGENLCFIEILDGAFGQENAAGGLGIGLYALHEHAIEERRERLDGLERGGLGAESQSGRPMQAREWNAGDCTIMVSVRGQGESVGKDRGRGLFGSMGDCWSSGKVFWRGKVEKHARHDG